MSDRYWSVKRCSDSGDSTDLIIIQQDVTEILLLHLKIVNEVFLGETLALE